MDGKSQHYVRLLDAVTEAGNDPDLAYVARFRLRRALISIERGRRLKNQRISGPHFSDLPELSERARSLQERVMHLCQPSESLDERWRREWKFVNEETASLRMAITAGG